MDDVALAQADDVFVSPNEQPKNEHARALEKIFNSEKFKAWERDVRAHSEREAERRAAARKAAASDPWHGRGHPRDADLCRQFGTLRTVRGRMA